MYLFDDLDIFISPNCDAKEVEDKEKKLTPEE